MARSKSKNVGLIGLGIIGSRVAAALRKRGLQVFVWNRTPRLEQYFVGSPVEVAELCDVVQIFVADDTALLETVRQLTPGLKAQHIVTAHCTVAPESMRAAAQIVERRGARFLEAPFTGSKVAAENGQLVYYIGGDEAALKQARPVLEASSKDILLIGEIGDASVIKVATNIVTAATAQIAGEALALLGKAGIEPELFMRAMKSNASNSATLEMKVPLMLAGDFEPHFSVKHMLKDVRIAAKLAREFSLDLPVTEVSSDMLLAELKRGRGDADYSSVVQKYFSGPQKIVRPEPRKIAEPPRPAEPVLEASEARPGATEPVAETRPPEPAMNEIPPMVTQPVAEAGPPEPESAPNEAPLIAAEPLAEAGPSESEAVLYEVPPMTTEPITETRPTEPEPVLYEAPPITTEPIAETRPPEPEPVLYEFPPITTEPLAETRPPEPEPVLYEVPPMTTEPVAETRPPEPEPVVNEFPPITTESVVEAKPSEPEPALDEVPPILPGPFFEVAPPKPVPAPNAAPPPTAEPLAEARPSEPGTALDEAPPILPGPFFEIAPPESVPAPKAAPPPTAEPLAETKPAEPAPTMYKPPLAVPQLVIKAKPTESRPQRQEPAPIPAKAVGETKSDQTAPKTTEPSPIPAESIVNAKPAKPIWHDDEEDEEDETPPGVNLSGGIRGWFSRRLSRRRF
jgi:3-hydroxyisobutyrate dehydrogenase-like beta-hydroxyacid dehydrogenase